MQLKFKLKSQSLNPVGCGRQTWNEREREMYGYGARCRSVSMDDDADSAGVKSALVVLGVTAGDECGGGAGDVSSAGAWAEGAPPATRVCVPAGPDALTLAARTRLDRYWVQSAEGAALPHSAARELFSLLAAARARWYEADCVFTGTPRGLAAGSLGLDELAEHLTLEDGRGRLVVAAALECVLAELPSDEILGCGAEFLACFAPLAHAAALRVGRDGRAALVAAIACPRRQMTDLEIRYVYQAAPEARPALRVFRGFAASWSA